MSHITSPELSHTPRTGSSIEEEKDLNEKNTVQVNVQEVSNWTIAEGDYTEAEYKRLVTKIDRCECTSIDIVGRSVRRERELDRRARAITTERWD